jgi:dolichol-phosphate mannosyltransferase
VIVYSIALRIAYMPSPNLISEEAYYWNYAQHLDWGYLDHPPMVAWIIKLGSMVLGNTEIGVRIGAMVCWLVAAGFGYGFARELLGRRTAVGVVLVMSVLPFFFGIGCIMTPDAPLTACWAGALFFLSRALLRERPGAWVAAGVCIGLGMLSKYTIGLLVPATVLFVLTDRRSRRWLARPQPYIACIVAAVLFSPVVYWNATHNWASFVFQTARRMNEAPIFSLHTLLGEIMLLLTPTVLAGAAAVLIARPLLGMRFARTAFTQRTRLFLLAFTLTPLAVVTVFSLTHEPKLNWTGPTWLAVLPFAVWAMAPAQKDRCGAFVSAIRRLWMPTIISMMLLLGAVFHFLALGFPGIPYPRHISDIAGWKDLQRQIAGIESATRAQTGTMPLIVGMDRYNISSELAFYGAPDGPSRTAGRNLFGQSGLMYAYWFPQSEQHGKTIIAVARERGPLEGGGVVSRFDSLTQIGTLPVSLNGRSIGQYYYRVGFGYRAQPATR